MGKNIDKRINRYVIIIVSVGTVIVAVLLTMLLVLMIDSRQKDKTDLAEKFECPFHNQSDGNNEIDKMIEEVYERAKSTSTSVKDDYSNNYVDIGNNDLGIPGSFEYNDKTYIYNCSYLDREYIGEELFSEEATGLSVHKIVHMTEGFALAVKHPKADAYYIYVTEHYVPESLGELLEKTGFYEAIGNMSVRLYPRDNDKEEVWYCGEFEEYLEYEFKEFTSTEYKLSDADIEPYTGLLIAYNMDHVKQAVYVHFCENGNIHIEIEGSMVKYYFETGEDGVEFANKLINYLVTNEEEY